MQEVRRRKTRSGPHGRGLLLLLSIAALLAALAGWWQLGRDAAEREPADHQSGEVLMSHEAEEVETIAVTLRSGEGWTAVREASGALTVMGDPAFAMSEQDARQILEAARTVSCDEVLTDDPSLYRDDLAAFGLEHPKLIAGITYADGQSIVLRVGDAVSANDAAQLYMTVDGDDRLFAVSRGMVEAFIVERALLYPVAQPVLHSARFDRIALTGPQGTVIGEWELEGDVGDADAGDHWMLVAPARYPADAEALSLLKENIAALRLGAYIGPATEENLSACGFDEPRLTLTVHQAAGSIGTVDAAGAYTLTEWPESAFTLVVGGTCSEDVDYIRYEDAIYTGSHYLLSVFMQKDYAETLTRYIAPTALGNLERLTVETAGGTDEYVITRREQVAENNELVTDLDGSVVYDVACTLNGEDVDYAAFEARYSQLILATVSGRLPAGWSAQREPHTVYTFFDVSGASHTVALVTFDALHDAVMMDGNAMFYLIKGGFTL